MNHAGWLGRHAGFLSHVSVDWFVGNTFVVFVWFGLVWFGWLVLEGDTAERKEKTKRRRTSDSKPRTCSKRELNEGKCKVNTLLWGVRAANRGHVKEKREKKKEKGKKRKR